MDFIGQHPRRNGIGVGTVVINERVVVAIDEEVLIDAAHERGVHRGGGWVQTERLWTRDVRARAGVLHPAQDRLGRYGTLGTPCGRA